jgi:phosphoribosylformylglycinamidine cyclo-ligase
VGKLIPEKVERIVSGIVDGCRQAGCALVGGETAEHPGLLAAHHFDLAGFVVGVVERERLLGPHRVQEGDLLVGLESPGLRCNGYSLARRVLLERSGMSFDSPAWEGAHATLADELLRPSVIYTPLVLDICERTRAVHAVAHVTGGGLVGNLVRVVPDRLDARIYSNAWPVPRIFEEIKRLGEVSDDEMQQVFNMGVGMVLVVEGSAAETCIQIASERGLGAWVIGCIESGSGRVLL